MIVSKNLCTEVACGFAQDRKIRSHIGMTSSTEPYYCDFAWRLRGMQHKSQHTHYTTYLALFLGLYLDFVCLLYGKLDSDQHLGTLFIILRLVRAKTGYNSVHAAL